VIDPTATLPRIVVAEDSPAIRARILEVLGAEYDVVAVGDGFEALEAIRKRPPSLVLSDVEMPRMNGLQLARTLRSKHTLRHIPIIFLTARKGGEQATVAGLDAGAVDYIVKPFDASELRARVRAGVRTHQLYVELEHTRNQLVDTARQAGMAEIATEILHNVGNVLNSVSVSASMIKDNARDMKIQGISKVSQRLHNLEGANGDEIGRLTAYLDGLYQHMEEARQRLLTESSSLHQNIDHIKQIVATQQQFARKGQLHETFELGELVSQAIEIQAATKAYAGIDIVVQLEESPRLHVNRHALLQVLTNLLGNARRAVLEAAKSEKRIVVRSRRGENGALSILVEDNGIGIKPEHQARIFEHGFTTRSDGHGFGLHASINAMRKLGGTLEFWSLGEGQGATFMMTLPTHAEEMAA
jgi:two-component system sensor histidine kinase ChiS